MDTNHLREFEAFAQTMSYSQAARMTFVSQPTLVAHIAALEKEVGARLVEKVGEVPRLTPAGKYLLGELTAVIGAAERLREECREVSACTLGLTIRNDTAYFNGCLDAAEKLYLQSRPGHRVELSFASSGTDRSRALDRGEIDFDIGARHRLLAGGDDRPHRRDLGDEVQFPQTLEPSLLFVSNESPLFAKECVEESDLDGATLLLPDTPSSHALGSQLAAAFARLGVELGTTYRRFRSLHEYYVCNRGAALGCVSPSTTQNIGFIGEGKTRRAFSVPQLPLTMVIYTAYCPKNLSDEKAAYVRALEEVGRSRCGLA